MMEHYKDNFIHWYFNELRYTELFVAMDNCFEDSQWHRERSVLIHTDMVVAQYLNRSEMIYRQELWGLLAVAFHDVGKPLALKINLEKDGKRKFSGHEIISARFWEDYAVTNFSRLKELFDFTPSDIYYVAWIIENHLPYSWKKDYKLDNLTSTIRMDITHDVFNRVLAADCWGRISDDHPTKKTNTVNWLSELNDRDNEWKPIVSESVVEVLIGASGVGKSTYVKTLKDYQYYSWDQLRLDWYTPPVDVSEKEAYSLAFEKSCKDGSFNSKAQKHFHDMLNGQNIVVDNTNLSAKRRRVFLDAAKRKGYRCVAVMFPIDLEQLMERVESRPDKFVPPGAVKGHYMRTSMPSRGEFDNVVVIGDNIRS